MSLRREKFEHIFLIPIAVGERPLRHRRPTFSVTALHNQEQILRTSPDESRSLRVSACLDRGSDVRSDAVNGMACGLSGSVGSVGAIRGKDGDEEVPLCFRRLL